MSFTSTSGARPLHVAGQQRWFAVAGPKPAAQLHGRGERAAEMAPAHLGVPIDALADAAPPLADIRSQLQPLS